MCVLQLTEMNTRWQVYNDERNSQMALQQRELEETKRMMELLRQQLNGKDQVQKELQQRAAVAEEARQQVGTLVVVVVVGVGVGVVVVKGLFPDGNHVTW